MNSIFYITIGITIFILLSLVSFLLYGMEKRIASRRLFQMTRGRGAAATPQVLAGVNKARPAVRQVSSWLSKLPLSFMRNALLPARLARAGYREPEAADIFISARVATPLVMLLIAAFMPAHRQSFLIAFPAVGYMLPDLFIRRKTVAHRKKIQQSLPDAIDLLVICVEAGLGMDQALHRVSQELAMRYPAITDEFVQLNLEQRAGKPRIQAWHAMAERLDLPEITSFLNMLIQTERFGTPISKALSNFAESLRERRRQAAEEKAAKTAVKITLPLALFIFPSIFIVLLGPAAITVMHSFPSLGH